MEFLLLHFHQICAIQFPFLFPPWQSDVPAYISENHLEEDRMVERPHSTFPLKTEGVWVSLVAKNLTVMILSHKMMSINGDFLSQTRFDLFRLASSR